MKNLVHIISIPCLIIESSFLAKDNKGLVHWNSKAGGVYCNE